MLAKEYKSLRIDNLVKIYRVKDEQIEIFRNFSLEVIEGDIIAIVGPSGCGKTTLLKIICGIVDHDGGNIVIGDGIIQLSSESIRIGLIFQESTLMPWLSLYQNIMLPYKIINKTSVVTEKTRVRAIELIEMVGLTGFEKYYPSQLSGGMQSRVALARALFMEPNILLLDEPFGSLDAITREEMQSLLIQILENTKATVILVTHSIDEAVMLSDKIIVLSKRPASIIKKIEVDIPRPRKENIRYDSRYIKINKIVRGLLAR